MKSYEDLQHEWMLQCQHWQGSPAMADATFRDLAGRYQRSNRHYHTLAHIRELLLLAKRHAADLECNQSMYFAIWFHDAIQELPQHNEAASAELARASLASMNAPSDIQSRVEEMILASALHTGTFNRDTTFFVDFDLAILGAKQSHYDAYRRNCRKEYAVSDELFVLGRAAFLQSMLERESIYLSPEFRASHEEKARQNINEELSLYMENQCGDF